MVVVSKNTQLLSLNENQEQTKTSGDRVDSTLSGLYRLKGLFALILVFLPFTTHLRVDGGSGAVF